MISNLSYKSLNSTMIFLARMKILKYIDFYPSEQKWNLQFLQIKRKKKAFKKEFFKSILMTNKNRKKKLCKIK